MKNFQSSIKRFFILHSSILNQTILHSSFFILHLNDSSFLRIQCGGKFLMSVGVPLWGRNRPNLYKSNKYFDRFG